GSYANCLRNKHSTSPSLAGLDLLYDCGHESLSDEHSRVCSANYTVIRNRDGPILRLKATPLCVLCGEEAAKDLFGYAAHLRSHKSSLKDEGIYLICSCDYEVRAVGPHLHSKMCDGRQFTIHKLDEEEWS
ncbi:hypothetical protein PENTCL1PPCAC_8231, partial [Pristionchus entomophagus]